MSHLLEAALALAEAGYAIFPLKPKDKVPDVPNGVKEATRDAEQITAWWTQKPTRNIGLALGGINGILAIDVDFKDGCRADFMNSIPPTVLTITPTGGRHVFFKIPDGGVKNAKKLERGATIRADGYYVVAAPSIHPETKTAYKWEREQKGSLVDGEIADCPEWIITCPEWSEKKTEIVGVGGRHEALKTKATALRFKGHDAAFLKDELLKFNETFEAPKEEKEIDQIIRWAMENVEPQVDLSLPETNDYINCLGHLDGTYYYTSSSNKQLVIIPRAQHTRLALCDLMPERFWAKKFPKKDKQGMVVGVNYDLVAVTLMEQSRAIGGFSSNRIKGTGAWMEESRALINLGQHLEIEGQRLDFGTIESKNVYIESMPLRPLHPVPLSNDGASVLIAAAEALKWEHPESAKYLLGWCAVARLCGALDWRPHCWLTGPSGSGKSTVIEMIVKNICGDMAIQPVGNSSEAGIRQAIKFNALPVIFDEAESNNRASAKRIQGVLELARQASSSSDARIMKGTASQTGIQFKINCIFFLSSIQVSLMEEADQNRFTVLELQRNDGNGWVEVKKKLDMVTEEFGDRLFARMIRLFPALQKSIEVFRSVIAEVHGQRIGLHYGTLLAGYWHLTNESVVTAEAARAEVKSLSLGRKESVEIAGDDSDCFDHLMNAVVPFQLPDGKTIRLQVHEAVAESHKIIPATPENPFQKQLQRYGVKVDEKNIAIACKSAELVRLFNDTKWEGNGSWVRTLARLPGAMKASARFNGLKAKAIQIPLATLKVADEKLKPSQSSSEDL
jgi:hypothetical protein